VPLHFNWSVTQIKEAAVSTGLVRKESKTKFTKRDRNRARPDKKWTRL
jgi:hypothetical protein